MYVIHLFTRESMGFMPQSSIFCAMKFSALNNSRIFVNVNIAKYLIDWDRTRGSKIQKRVKDFFYPYWRACIVCEELRIPKSLLRVDLMCISRKIAVEVSPSSTHSFSRFFHKNRPAFGRAVGRELDKAKWLEREGYQLIEIFEDDLGRLSKEWVLEKYKITL